MEKEEILKRLDEIKKIKKELKLFDTSTFVDKITKFNQDELIDGISVVVPIYKGERYILKCLETLYNQTLNKQLFDVIFIINGEKDNTDILINEFIEKNKINNFYVLYSSIPSASNARNIGIKQAIRKYSVFLDVDDYLSSNYLEELYNFAEDNSVVVSQIVDIDSKGFENHDNPINREIIQSEDKEKTFETLNKVATISACKLIPTVYLKDIKFDTSLKSGEDIVFFTKLFTKNDLTLKVIPIKNKAVYYRLLRNNSVSRQEMTFDFYVNQRLQVIVALNSLLNETDDVNKLLFIKRKINSQSMFINRYIKSNIQERENVIALIRSYNLEYMPYEYVNKGLADKLIISYCFPPYADTSGNVMAKRLREMNDVVDIVYNKMDKVREIDKSLNSLVDDLIERRLEIPSYPSFSNWKAINDFCNIAMSKIGDKSYKEIYSRVMWPGSHFLAYRYKLQNPQTKWTAEFSDPIILNIEGKERYVEIEDEQFIKKANKLIWKKYKLPKVNNNNLFFWCEYLPYLYADELIFTNEKQLKYMIDNFPISSIKKIIKEKAKIKPQPSMSKEFYQIASSNYKLDSEKVNIAYFGTFYKTRDLNDLFLGLEGLNKYELSNIVLHIFTSNPKELDDQLSGTEIYNSIKINSYVSYLEFLYLTTKFDCLVINDANTRQYKSINPYLPSKLSDYLGSGTDIWAIYEKSSILSTLSLPYKSELGKIDEATSVMKQLVQQKIGEVLV